MTRLRITEDGELTAFTNEGNYIAKVDLTDEVTIEAMRLTLGAPVERETEHIDRPRHR